MKAKLAVLKLASAFCNDIDARDYCRVVKIKQKEDGITDVIATDGHVMIKIETSLLGMNELEFDLITFKSIKQACKVDSEVLLCEGEGVRYPNFERVLERREQLNVESATFDIDYMYKIFTALNAFCKTLKIKKRPVTISPLVTNDSNMMMIDLPGMGSGRIKIELAIMPLRTK
jgi:hypothetical protein